MGSTHHITDIAGYFNHLNDIAKKQPELVVDLLQSWTKDKDQDAKELAWMSRHALRTLVKQGHGGALTLLGYRNDVGVEAALSLSQDTYAIGDVLELECTLQAPETLPILVDYRILFARPNGKSGEKVFKLKVGQIAAGKPLKLAKKHRLKGDATTFKLYPGAHQIVLQVNGVDVAQVGFDLT